MAIAAPTQRIPTGSVNPRLAPPLPANTWLEQFVEVGESADIMRPTFASFSPA